MKTTQEMSTADRISTHEELHQVLALLNEPPDHATTDSDPESEGALQDAVTSLWQDETEDEQPDPEGAMYRWAELAAKTESVN